MFCSGQLEVESMQSLGGLEQGLQTAVVLQDIVGDCEARLPVGLSGDDLANLNLFEAVPVSYALDLCRWGAVYHQYPISKFTLV